MKRNPFLSTVVFVLALAAVGAGAYFYKQSQLKKSPPDRESAEARPPRILSEFSVMNKVSVVSPDTALGHKLTLQDANGARYAVSLYFVECPPLDLDDATNTPVARLSRYFGNVPFEKLLEGGARAKDFSLNLLATRPFRFATLFTPTKAQSGIHGFILVRDENDKESYLSELLVKEGLAAISVQGSHLPFGEPRSAYRNYLIGLEREARKAKRGLWEFSRSETEGGANEEPVGPKNP